MLRGLHDRQSAFPESLFWSRTAWRPYAERTHARSHRVLGRKSSCPVPSNLSERAGRSTIGSIRSRPSFSKPHNVILLLLGIVLTFTTVAPIVAIVQDTFKIHAGTIDAHLTGQASGYTLVNYIDLFTSRMAKTNLWTPLLNTVLLAVGTCIVSILYGGLFAFLITRTDLALEKISELHFHFPVHHAAVDAGRRVAEPVQFQRRHRHVQRPACRHCSASTCRYGGARACSRA